MALYHNIQRYATDLLREAYFRSFERTLTDLQARGILQHHKTLGNTDILDLTYDPQQARRFALDEANKREPFTSGDYSSIYQVVVRLLNHPDEPLPVKFRGRTVYPAPYNIYELETVTRYALQDRAFGISHLGPDDNDAYGMVMNVTEWLYHPVEAPQGWATLPKMNPRATLRDSLLVPPTMRGDDLQAAPTWDWLGAMLQSVKRRVLGRFGLAEMW
jgi:hypothetical protein